MAFFAWLWESIVWFFVATFPARYRSKAVLARFRGVSEKEFDKVHFESFARTVRWVLHVLIVVCIIVLLWWINSKYDLERVLRSPFRFLHAFWLPLLFVLVYALCWLGYGLLRLIAPDTDTLDFPDIDEAFAEIQRTLDDAGIDPTVAPLFLVLGRPHDSVEGLFGAAKVPFQLRHVPKRNDAPIHVYASREAIFLTCEGASLLGRAAALLAEEPKDLPPPEPIDPPTPPAAKGVSEAQPEGTAVAVLAPETSEMPQRRLTLLKDLTEVDRATARLRHLCRLLARRREPFCAANGLLVLVPLAATENDEDAEEAARLCRLDIGTAREALRVYCPTVAILSDAERLPGFDELIRRFPEESQRQQALGVRFPLRPRLSDDAIPGMIEEGLGWLTRALLPLTAFRGLQVESSNGTNAEAILDANAKLVTLLGTLLERQPRLARILTEGIALPEDGPPLFGGCYLAATGADAAREQGFAHAALRQLIESQNAVAWTTAARAEEDDYARLSRYAYVAVFLAAAGITYLVYRAWVV